MGINIARHYVAEPMGPFMPFSVCLIKLEIPDLIHTCLQLLYFPDEFCPLPISQVSPFLIKDNWSIDWIRCGFEDF